MKGGKERPSLLPVALLVLGDGLGALGREGEPIIGEQVVTLIAFNGRGYGGNDFATMMLLGRLGLATS